MCVCVFSGVNLCKAKMLGKVYFQMNKNVYLYRLNREWVVLHTHGVSQYPGNYSPHTAYVYIYMCTYGKSTTY